MDQRPLFCRFSSNVSLLSFARLSQHDCLCLRLPPSPPILHAVHRECGRLAGRAQTPKAKTPGAGSRAAMAQLATATAASDIQVAPGFKVELLYAVPKADQGLVGCAHRGSERSHHRQRPVRRALPDHGARTRHEHRNKDRTPCNRLHEDQNERHSIARRIRRRGEEKESGNWPENGSRRARLSCTRSTASTSW